VFPAYRIAAVFAALAAISLLLRASPPIVSFARFAWLGSISYAMYVIHGPVAHTIYPMVPRDWAEVEWWLVNAAVIAAVFLMSYLLEVKMQPMFRAYMVHFQKVAAVQPILGKCDSGAMGATVAPMKYNASHSNMDTQTGRFNTDHR